MEIAVNTSLTPTISSMPATPDRHQVVKQPAAPGALDCHQELVNVTDALQEVLDHANNYFLGKDLSMDAYTGILGIIKELQDYDTEFRSFQGFPAEQLPQSEVSKCLHRTSALLRALREEGRALDVKLKPHTTLTSVIERTSDNLQQAIVQCQGVVRSASD